MNAPDGYCSRFNPEIELTIYLMCSLDELTMQMGLKVSKLIRLRHNGWFRNCEIVIQHMSVPDHRGNFGYAAPKQIPLAYSSDHEYFNIHVENALKKAYEHIAQLHGNTATEVEGFDLFA